MAQVLAAEKSTPPISSGAQKRTELCAMYRTESLPSVVKISGVARILSRGGGTGMQLFWSGIRVRQHRSEFIQLLPFTKNLAFSSDSAMSTASVISRFSSSIADNATSVFSADESSRRETLRGRLSGSSVSKQLSVATLWVCEPVAETGECVLFTT